MWLIPAVENATASLNVRVALFKRARVRSPSSFSERVLAGWHPQHRRLQSQNPEISVLRDLIDSLAREWRSVSLS